MNLKNFQQSELKRFDEELDRITCNLYADGRANKVGVVKKAKKELNYIIEKAYALGKEEKGKEILADVEKIDGGAISSKEASEEEPYYLAGFEKAISEVIKIIKLK